MKNQALIAAFLLLCAPTLRAQKDTVVMTNNDLMVGEIKSLNNGVLIIKTTYSDEDFKVKWDKVKEVYSLNRFLITLDNGLRTNGNVRTLRNDTLLIGRIYEADTVYTTVESIVYHKGLEKKFWDRIDINLDLGINYTKANQLRQFSLRSKIVYLADKWDVELYYNANTSVQDSATATRRYDAGIGYNYYLQNDWFASYDLTFLANTEQAIKLRTNGKVGIGKFIVHTNHAYWGAGAGLAFNNEQFTNETQTRNSIEAFIGAELNLFDVGDLNMLTSLYAYPSLTERRRIRSDLKIDLKYDLPNDFYVKTGITLNYDNRPAISGNETDYVFYTTFGWEF
jgi:hypothetical protein